MPMTIATLVGVLADCWSVGWLVWLRCADTAAPTILVAWQTQSTLLGMGTGEGQLSGQLCNKHARVYADSAPESATEQSAW